MDFLGCQHEITSFMLFLAYSSLIMMVIILVIVLVRVEQIHTALQKKAEYVKKEEEACMKHTIAMLDKIIENDSKWLPLLAKKVNAALPTVYNFTFEIEKTPKKGPLTFDIIIKINNMHAARLNLIRTVNKTAVYNTAHQAAETADILIDDFHERGCNSALFNAMKAYTTFETAMTPFRKIETPNQ